MKYSRTFAGWNLSRAVARVVIVAICAATISAFPSRSHAAGWATYTALGDSLAFGAFAFIGSGYVPLYERHVERDTGTWVQLINYGIPGWQSADLRNATRTNGLFRLSIFYSAIVTWNIGGNDLNSARNKYKDGVCGGPLNQDCFVVAVSALKSNWDGIITNLLALRRGRPTVFRTMTIYNPFVNEDRNADSWDADAGLTDLQAIKPYLDDVNDYIKTTSAAVGIQVAPVYEAFNGPAGDEDPDDKDLLSFDGFHPNGRGHATMAALLRSLGYAAIVP